MVRNRITNLRKEHGLNQKELGDKLGVVQTTISAWETGRSEPDNETLNKLSQLFKVSIGYVAGYEKVRKNIPLSDEERFEEQLAHHEEAEERYIEGLIEENENQLELTDFLKNGKGLFLESFLFNKACEYMSQAQRNRALIILKNAFPTAFNSSYNPD